jgi:hypothetical protein
MVLVSHDQWRRGGVRRRSRHGQTPPASDVKACAFGRFGRKQRAQGVG